MNFERVLECLSDYRTQNEYFDRLVGAVMRNKLAARAVRASVAAAASASRARRVSLARRVSRPGQYEQVFFIAGEMRSGTSWLRRTLDAHPEIACGQEGS